MTSRQFGARCMACSISNRGRSRRLLRRGPPRAYLPNRDEPRRTCSPSVAPYRLDRMDRWVRTGRVGSAALHDWCPCVQGWHPEFAATVSDSHSGLRRYRVETSRRAQVGVDDGFHDCVVGTCSAYASASRLMSETGLYLGFDMLDPFPM